MSCVSSSLEETCFQPFHLQRYLYILFYHLILIPIIIFTIGHPTNWVGRFYYSLFTDDEISLVEQLVGVDEPHPTPGFWAVPLCSSAQAFFTVSCPILLRPALWSLPLSLPPMQFTVYKKKIHFSFNVNSDISFNVFSQSSFFYGCVISS